MKKYFAVVGFFAVIGTALLMPMILTASANNTSASANWIKDPGFENNTLGYWSVNNWAKNKIDCGLDTKKTHSGQFCMRLSMTKVTGRAASLQFVSKALPVKSQMAIQLKFWIRGIPNAGSVLFQLRKRDAPYTSYWSASIMPSSEWNEYIFNIICPEKIDTETTALFITLKSVNTIWLDDVSIKVLPAKDGGKPIEGNLVKNGSFEVGRTHWYGRYRERGGYAFSDIAFENNINADITPVIDLKAPHGKRALHLKVYKHCSFMLISSYFNMRYGYPSVLTFYTRMSAANKRIIVSIDGGKVPNTVKIIKKTIKSNSTGWEKHSISFTPEAAPGKVYIVKFETTTPGEYWLDGITINEGIKPISCSPNPANIGWVSVDKKHPANIYYKNDPVKIKIIAEVEKDIKSAKVFCRVIDAWGKTIKKDGFTVTIGANNTGEKIIVFPSGLYGGFLVELYYDTFTPEKTPDCDFFYNVVPKLKEPGKVNDSFFGGHVYLTPYNLHIAKMAGMRWVRLHPPLTTKWIVTEPKQKKFNYIKTGVARAHNMGFKILGSLNTVPSFYADMDPGKKSTVWRSYPPKDWSKWKEYVKRTITEYKDYINAWEIWNEPDSGFLQLRKGVKREDVCMDMAKYTLEVVKENNFNVTLVGYGMSNFKRPVTAWLLENNVGQYLDAFSAHMYGGEFSPDEYPGNPTMVEFSRQVGTYKSRSGKPLGYWMTEGGIFISGGKSYRRSAKKPASSSYTLLTACHSLVRTMVSLKACGTAKHFYYQMFTHQAGSRLDRDECMGIMNADGTPQAALAAHAVCVSILEGAKPLGLEIKKAGKAKIRIGRFMKNGKKITVVWSRIPSTFAAAGIELENRLTYNMMGNSIAVNSDTEIKLDPIYIIEK
ncbi:MAG: hypothetical protein L3J71_18300 [Victivallaceae bacterium]|nr:hypothetical protein [Victivallaceae bacterium]